MLWSGDGKAFRAIGKGWQTAVRAQCKPPQLAGSRFRRRRANGFCRITPRGTRLGQQSSQQSQQPDRSSRVSPFRRRRCHRASTVLPGALSVAGDCLLTLAIPGDSCCPGQPSSVDPALLVRPRRGSQQAIGKGSHAWHDGKSGHSLRGWRGPGQYACSGGRAPPPSPSHGRTPGRRIASRTGSGRAREAWRPPDGLSR